MNAAPIIFFILTAALPVLLVIFLIATDKERPDTRLETLRKLAPQLRLEPLGEFEAPPPTLVDLFAYHPDRANKRIRRVLQGTHHGRTLLVFDYSYTNANDRLKQTSKQTVVAIDLKASQIKAPSFILRERQTADWFKKMIDYTFVDLPPLAGHLALLIFEPTLRPRFEAIPNEFWYELRFSNGRVLCDGRWFVYYHQGYQLPLEPEAYHYLIGRAVKTLAYVTEKPITNNQ